MNQEGLINEPEDSHEIDRILDTNHNNFEALQYAVNTKILPVITVFLVNKNKMDINDNIHVSSNSAKAKGEKVIRRDFGYALVKILKFFLLDL